MLAVDVGALDRAVGLCGQILGELDARHSDLLRLKAQLTSKLGDDLGLEALERLAECESDATKRSQLWAKRRANSLRRRARRIVRSSAIKKAIDADARNTGAAVELRAVFASQGGRSWRRELLQREDRAHGRTVGQGATAGRLSDLRLTRLNERGPATAAFRKAIEVRSDVHGGGRNARGLRLRGQGVARAARYYEPLFRFTTEMPAARAKELCVRCGDALIKLRRVPTRTARLPERPVARSKIATSSSVANVRSSRARPMSCGALPRHHALSRSWPERRRRYVYYRPGNRCVAPVSSSRALPILNEAELRRRIRPLVAVRQIYEALSQWDPPGADASAANRARGRRERFGLLVEAGDIFMQKLAPVKAQKCYVAALEIHANDPQLLGKLMAVTPRARTGRDSWKWSSESRTRRGPTAAREIFHDRGGDPSPGAPTFPGRPQATTRRHSTTTAAAQRVRSTVACHAANRAYEQLAAAYRAQLRRSGVTRCSGGAMLRMWDTLADVLTKEPFGDPQKAAEALGTRSSSRRAVPRRASYGDLRQRSKANFRKAVRMHRYSSRVHTEQRVRARAAPALSDVGLGDEAWCVAQTLTVLDLADPTEGAVQTASPSKPATAQEFFTGELWFQALVARG